MLQREVFLPLKHILSHLIEIDANRILGLIIVDNERNSPYSPHLTYVFVVPQYLVRRENSKITMYIYAKAKWDKSSKLLLVVKEAFG